MRISPWETRRLRRRFGEPQPVGAALQRLREINAATPAKSSSQRAEAAAANTVQTSKPHAWEPAGEVIRVIPSGRERERLDVEERLRQFEQARPRPPAAERGWRREDLYDRGLPR